MYKKKSLSSGDEGTNLSPIFIYGQFRTRTTWWFAQFRRLSQCMCFYTPLTPILIDYTPKEASESLKNLKSLRHETTGDYYLEYPGYPDKYLKTARDWTTHPYIMTPEDDDPEMEQHFNYLINYAHKRGKRPVFKLNWAILRGSWIKSRFGGTHIFLDRDAPSIRRSFDSFRGSLSWAWRDLVMIIGQNQDHPLMEPLMEYLGYEQPDDLDYFEARKVASRFCRSGKLDQTVKLELISYFQKLARIEADFYADYQVGDIDDVGKVERDIYNLTGLKVDLSTYKEKPPAREDDPVHFSSKKVRE